jgi:hypothetical protein
MAFDAGFGFILDSLGIVGILISFLISSIYHAMIIILLAFVSAEAYKQIAVNKS